MKWTSLFRPPGGFAFCIFEQFFFFSLFADVLFDIRLCFPILVSLGGFLSFLPDGGLAFGVLSVGHGGIMICFLFFVLFFRHRFGACGVVRLGGRCMVSRTGALLFVFVFCFTSYFYHLSTTATAATTDIIITLHSIVL